MSDENKKQMTVEIATNNLVALLGSNELKLNKNDHIVLEQSLIFLSNTAKEVEILRNRVKDLELIKKKK